MDNMKKWVSGALAAGAAAGLVLLTQFNTDQPVEAHGRTGVQPVSTAGQLSGPASGSGAAHAGLGAQASLSLESPWVGAAAGASTAAALSPLSTMSPPRFAVDSRGKLVLDADTHANLEKLLLQEDQEAMRATLAKISTTLPAQAGADLKVLVDQFQQYTKAHSHSISPENAPDNEQEGLKLLDSLHTLRVSYLGAETTQAMFGEEEATTRQLLALMAADRNPNLTQQEKAERAQEIINKRRPPTVPPAR